LFSHIQYSQQKQNKILDKLGWGGHLRKLNTQRFKKFNRQSKGVLRTLRRGDYEDYAPLSLVDQSPFSP